MTLYRALTACHSHRGHDGRGFVPTTANLMQYAEMVVNTHKRQVTHTLAGELLEALDGGNMGECQEIAGKIQTSLSHSAKQNTWDANSAFLEYYLTLKEEPRFIATGFQTLDKCAFISPGDYVAVGGRPSSGKTALTLQIAAYMAKTRDVVYFSLETNRFKIMRRLVALAGGGSMGELLNRTVDLNTVHEASKGLRASTLHIVEAGVDGESNQSQGHTVRRRSYFY